eukprot:6270148-Heterocapsa_arctica.AAC.1
MSLISPSSTLFNLASSSAVRAVRSWMFSIRRSSASFSFVSNKSVTWVIMLAVTSATTDLPMSMLCC